MKTLFFPCTAALALASNIHETGISETEESGTAESKAATDNSIPTWKDSDSEQQTEEQSFSGPAFLSTRMHYRLATPQGSKTRGLDLAGWSSCETRDKGRAMADKEPDSESYTTGMSDSPHRGSSKLEESDASSSSASAAGEGPHWRGDSNPHAVTSSDSSGSSSNARQGRLARKAPSKRTLGQNRPAAAALQHSDLDVAVEALNRVTLVAHPQVLRADLAGELPTGHRCCNPAAALACTQ